MAPAVFKTDVVEQLGQAGSIPVRLRHIRVAIDLSAATPPARRYRSRIRPDPVRTRPITAAGGPSSATAAAARSGVAPKSSPPEV